LAFVALASATSLLVVSKASSMLSVTRHRRSGEVHDEVTDSVLLALEATRRDVAEARAANANRDPL
jgi:hypothetical protein